MRQLLPLVMMLFAITCAANGNTLITRQMKAAPFDAIEAECVDVYITVGPSTGKFSVTGTREVLDKFSAYVSKGKLKLSGLKSNTNNSLKGFFKKNKRAMVKITVPSLREIDAEMSAKVVVDKALAGNDIEVSSETSSSVSLAGINATSAVELESETSSSISVGKLSAPKVKVSAETSSTVEIESLKAQTSKLDAETSSCISVENVNVEDMKATAETASTVKASAGTINYGKFNAETASKIDFENVRVSKGTASGDSAGAAKVKFGER